MEKVVLDLNTIISGSLFHGNEAEILALLRRKRFRAVISKKMIGRLATALNYPHLTKYLNGRAPNTVLENTIRNFEIVEDKEQKIPFKLDKDDSAVLACAVSEKADFLVTGDHKLLEIKKYNGVSIITSAYLLQHTNNALLGMEKFRGTLKGSPPFVRDKRDRVFD